MGEERMTGSPGCEPRHSGGVAAYRPAARAIGLAVLTLSLALTTACTQSGSTDKTSVRKESLTGQGKAGQKAAGPPRLTLSPAADAVDVAVADGVRVTAVSAVL